MSDPGATGPKPLHFSSAVLPERRRVAAWREEFGRTLLRVDIQPATEAPIHARATLLAFDGFRMIACASSPMHYRRSPDLVADGDDSIGLVVNLDQEARVAQAGTSAHIARGDAIVLLGHKPAYLGSTGHIGMVFPRAALAARVSAIDKTAGRVLPRRNEALRLLVAYLRALNGKRLLTIPGLPEAAVNHVHELAVLSLDAEADIAASGLGAVGAARLAEALEAIARQFADPEFSVGVIARRQNVSARYLQRLIESTGQSFTERVTALRLRRAFDLLNEPHSHERKIAEIALQAGFSDLSHFNRLFRAKFGETPRAMKARQRHV